MLSELRETVLDANLRDWVIAISYLMILIIVGFDFVFDDVRHRITPTRLRYLIVMFVVSIPLGFLVGAAASKTWDALSFAAPDLFVEYWRQHALVSWVACFVAMDLAGYWYHRIGHMTSIGWAGHQPHHLGEHYDTTLVARQPWLIVHGLIIFPLVALAGFDLSVATTCATISLAYQALQHTSRSWSLGPLRHVLITGHTHRRHHSTTGMHTNYGFVFSTWDHIFGTWQPQPVTSDELFGIGAEPTSVLEAQFSGWVNLVKNKKFFTNNIRQ